MSAATSGSWNCRVELGGGEAVIMHSPSSLVHYPAAHFQPLRHDVDYQPRVVLRGFAELNEVGTGEPWDCVVYVFSNYKYYLHV